MFALGSTLYELATGHRPYHDLASEDVEDRFRRGVFPETEGHLFARMVLGCWGQGFESAAIVKQYGDSMRELSADGLRGKIAFLATSFLARWTSARLAIRARALVRAWLPNDLSTLTQVLL